MAALVAVLLVGAGLEARAQTAKPQPLLPVEIKGPSFGPSPSQDGTGLCTTSKVSSNPDSDFRSETGAGGFSYYLNLLIDSSSGARASSVLQTPFDLSNNNEGSQQKLSYGDFVGAIPGCPQGGCGFYVNDTASSFGTRMRGYLNVPPALVNKELHFGFFTDDGVTLVIYDKNKSHRIVDRPPKRGFPSWHTTNSVIFRTEGLYPVELLYAALGGDSALEMSVLVGGYADIEHEATQLPAINLKADGFALVDNKLFYQAETGRQSYPDPSVCQQCNRENANTTGNNGCDPSYYCNSAALCSPCDSAIYCGPSCSPCGGTTPNCINRNGTFACAECSTDADCKSTTGRCDLETNTCAGCNTDAQCSNGQRCDTEAHVCRDCLTDAHCGRGQSCTNNTCQSCSSDDSCAGTSCNCCPEGLQCAAPTPGSPPTCVECTNDAQCADGKRCDLINGRCVEKLSECNTSDRCGSQCLKCPTDRPYCLDGQVCVGCRSDMECGDGNYCVSGECSACTTDKRCGPRCGACPTETPVCLTDGTAAGSSCVGCTEDAHCGPGGVCDPVSRTCSTPECTVSCADGALCSGNTCVECFTDAHCPCGGTCDTATNACTRSCRTSGDCLGVEYCSAVTLQCEHGRRKPGTETQGGPPCCGVTDEAAPSSFALLLLAAAALATRRTRSVA